MNRPLRIATRKSKLALTQTRQIAELLKGPFPQLDIEEVQVVTSGDRFRDQPLQDIGGKGLFIKEIERALLDDQADIAVHSIKDVPAQLAPGLRLVAIAQRVDPRDVIVSRDGTTLDRLPAGSVVGTSSLRRRTALQQVRSDLRFVPLRGNVDTRLRKLEQGDVDVIVLALAGLQRMKLSHRASEILDPARCLPAVGQGALGIEARDGDDRIAELLAPLHHQPTALCVAAERAFMAGVEGNCRLPVAAYAQRREDELWLRAMFAQADGSQVRFGERSAPWTEQLQQVEALGTELAAELRNPGTTP